MSFLARQLPRRLSMWVLGKSLSAAMDATPLIRLGLLGLGTVMIGALLAVAALVGLLGALYMYLITMTPLSPAMCLLIVSVLCASLSGAAFYYMRVHVLEVPRTNFTRIRSILANSLQGSHSELFHTSKDILRNFADGFMRK